MNIKKLFENYDLISLGYNCFPKLFIKKLINKETHFFDYVGSSTWSILKLLENNFDNFLNKKFYYYPHEKFMPHIDTLYNITNKEYYLRFIHDNNFLKNDETWNDFENKYKRRIDRFNELLKSDKNLLFFYLEDTIFRLEMLYEEIKQYYPTNKENYEIEQSKLEQSRMFEIVDIIKKKYNKHNFKIIYFSNLIEKTYYNNNIIFIKTDCHYSNIKWDEWAQKQCIKSINDNYDYITQFLQNNKTN